MLLKLCVLPLVAILLGGCAHSYVDERGNSHIIGLVKLTISPATTEPGAADWVRLRTVSISLNRSSLANSLDIGISDNTQAVFRNLREDALIIGNDYAFDL